MDLFRIPQRCALVHASSKYCPLRCAKDMRASTPGPASKPEAIGTVCGGTRVQPVAIESCADLVASFIANSLETQ
ncbi:hypothetical protein DF118_13960 [Burkholderia stagnalis]|nr:hypothetical protein WT33_08365 [Burkholderia stagnalis]RQQ30148.1 hypothetical protein DF163_14900 [Burkholderia stagnalis]RQQ51377.1 hypothetical protein DF162_10620 [Burkholderia stagnalis]RQX98903.1 hypothetical protein DF119_15005 [Burkholderia stagnalis]RQY12843.1 hypothetical protein DF118_13960 [Burkholderia stagnalis]